MMAMDEQHDEEQQFHDSEGAMNQVVSDARALL
jgi:hypothetical protein